VRFTWDPRKAASNLAKHGIAFEEAVTVFADALAIIAADDEHAERSIIVGQSAEARMLVTVFIETVTDSGEDETRIISARRATRQERRQYEEGEAS
jgi:uncharacterized protein